MSSPDPGSVSSAMAASRLAEPAWVRNGSPRVQKEYALGLEFERMLVQQLAGSLTASTEPGSEGAEGEGGSGGGDAAAGVLSNMIPGALADGVVAGGGLGLAAQLTREIEARAPGVSSKPDASVPADTAPAGPGGGTEADVTGGARA